MIFKNRQVFDHGMINEMLKMMDIMYISMNDEDGFPYTVPVNFGYEMTDTQLIVYFHTPCPGKKNNLFKKDPRVCLAFSTWYDHPDIKYKGKRHDYRSVIAKGTVKLVLRDEDQATWDKAYGLMFTCNHREVKPFDAWDVLPKIYMGVITCDLKDVTAKSEVPIHSIEEVPFVNVYELED